jgi:cold shock CspA family protein
MEARSDYSYEAYNDPQVRKIRISQQEWLAGAPPLGANGLPVAQGIVSWFDLAKGIGMIVTGDTHQEVFFHFTAIPGEGYRTVKPGAAVRFELVENKTGLTARNVQVVEK